MLTARLVLNLYFKKIKPANESYKGEVTEVPEVTSQHASAKALKRHNRHSSCWLDDESINSSICHKFWLLGPIESVD